MELSRSTFGLPAMITNASRSARLATAVAVFALGAAACGSDGDEGVAVDGAWARTSPMSAEAGAAYFQISSGDDDVLIGASVDSAVADRVEIHETRMVEMGDDSMDEDAMGDEAMGDEAEGGAMEGMGDVMQMVEVGRIELPAGETVSLEPGGLHLMLLDLPDPLELGETFDITLDFENGPDEVVEVEVRDDAPE